MDQNKTDAQFVKKSFAFYRGRSFITVLQNPTSGPYSIPVECSQHSGIPCLLNPFHTADNELHRNYYSSTPKFLCTPRTQMSALYSLVPPCVRHDPPLKLLLTLSVVTTACMVKGNLDNIVIESYLCGAEAQPRTT